MTKTTFELTMNCIKIIEKFFTTAPAVADLNDSETAERVDDISNLLCDSSDIEDKDIDRYLDLVYFFYNNNCLLRDIYNLKTDESVKKSLELEYLRFSFLTFSEGSISRITFKDLGLLRGHRRSGRVKIWEPKKADTSRASLTLVFA